MESVSDKAPRSSVKKPPSESNQSDCASRWWKQDFPHQKRLGTFLDHPLCHLLIIILVVVECICVIIEILLHTLKGQSKCNAAMGYSRPYSEKDLYKLEYTMNICHFLSLTILSIFLFEILLKIYALGYHYWNCKENHLLDYFDAILVAFSFSVEIYFLIEDKESILAHTALLIVALRLWHIVRIANAAVRFFQKGGEFKEHHREIREKRSADALLIPPSIQALLHLLQDKTEYLRRDLTIEQSIVDRFEDIDQKCQDAFEDYYGDDAKLLEEIEKLNIIPRKIPKKKNYSLVV